MHFLGLKLILNFWHLLKHNCNLFICVFKWLNTLESSKNNFINTPLYFWKNKLITFQYVNGTFWHWNCINSEMKVFQLVMKVLKTCIKWDPYLQGYLLFALENVKFTKEARRLRKKQMHFKNIVTTFLKVDWILKFNSDHVWSLVKMW